MGSIDKFVARMEYWCEVADLGYDQWQRQDIYDGGECDCSSLVIFALKEAGFDTGSASYTGNMSSNLTSRGWSRVINNGFPRPGDILLNDANHVGVWTGYGVAQASGDENYNIHGGEAGDQTGYETFITSGYYNYPWDCYLRYTGDQYDEPVDERQPRYAVSTDPSGIDWCDDMYGLVDSGCSGDDFAGNGGAIYFLAVQGVTYQVKSVDAGWLDPVHSFNKGDLVNGCAGNEYEHITAIRIYDDDIMYRVWTNEDGWLDWMRGTYDTGGSGDDFAGNKDHPIRKIQIKRV